MNASTPIIIDGKTYDKFSLNLIVSGSYTPDGKPGASVVCNLVPTRIEGDTVETVPHNATNIRLGDLAQADEPTLIAVGEISAALQKFILSKGL